MHCAELQKAFIGSRGNKEANFEIFFILPQNLLLFYVKYSKKVIKKTCSKNMSVAETRARVSNKCLKLDSVLKIRMIVLSKDNLVTNMSFVILN